MFLPPPLKITIPIYLSALLLLSSCAVNQNALFVAKTDAIADTLSTVYVVNEGVSDTYYRIKSQDQIAIRNLQNLEFGASETASAGTATFIVNDDGSLNLPVVGKTAIAGLTRSEAREKLQRIYEQQLLKNPIIDVSVVNLKVTLLGEFTSTGNYLLEKDNTTLIDILGESKGLTKQADTRRIKIIRGDRKNPEIIYVNLQNINSLTSPKLVLQNGDIVYAETRGLFKRQQNLQASMTIIQPLLVLVNTAVIIYNLSNR